MNSKIGFARVSPAFLTVSRAFHRLERANDAFTRNQFTLLYQVFNTVVGYNHVQEPNNHGHSHGFTAPILHATARRRSNSKWPITITG